MYSNPSVKTKMSRQWSTELLSVVLKALIDVVKRKPGSLCLSLGKFQYLYLPLHEQL